MNRTFICIVTIYAYKDLGQFYLKYDIYFHLTKVFAVDFAAINVSVNIKCVEDIQAKKV